LPKSDAICADATSTSISFRYCSRKISSPTRSGTTPASSGAKRPSASPPTAPTSRIGDVDAHLRAIRRNGQGGCILQVAPEHSVLVETLDHLSVMRSRVDDPPRAFVRLQKRFRGGPRDLFEVDGRLVTELHAHLGEAEGEVALLGVRMHGDRLGVEAEHAA